MHKQHADVGAVSVFDQYPVFPEQEGEWDRPLNPYSPV